jgi:hypothetical protein
MALESICTPALIYLVFSIVQIVLDTGKGLYNTAFLKLFVTFIFTIFLNYLCDRGLGVISWIIVFIPFILMSIIISILLLMLGLDPTTGKLKINGSDTIKPVEDPRKSSVDIVDKIPIQPIIYSKPTEQQTGTSLLKNLEDDLKDVDYSAYSKIAELDKELSGPYPSVVPRPPVSTVVPRPPTSSVVPNPYNVKNTAPFVNESESTYYEKLTPENKKIFDNLPTNTRQNIDTLYLIFHPDPSKIKDTPSDELNAMFIKGLKEHNI